MGPSPMSRIREGGSSWLIVIETTTNTVVTAVPVEAYPIGVAITPDGAFAYVTNHVSNTVSVIATATNTVVATVPVGLNPGVVAFVGYSISGTVANGGEGITVKLSGATSQTTTTDENGTYQFTELSNGAYTITPGKTGWAFIPKSKSVHVKRANLTGQDFTFASVTVTSPNGRQSWKAGTTHTISWTYKGNPGDFVKVELLEGGSASLLKSGVSIGTNGKGSWSWTIPKKKTPGTDYKIRVTSTTIGRCKDASNKNFTITGPTITVTSPNGGESWQAGTQHTISWSYTDNPGSYVKVELLKGDTATVLNSSVSIGQNGIGSCAWTIPETTEPGADYRIRVSSTAYDLWTDTTDASFTINDSTLVQGLAGHDQ